MQPADRNDCISLSTHSPVTPTMKPSQKTCYSSMQDVHTRKFECTSKYMDTSETIHDRHLVVDENNIIVPTWSRKRGRIKRRGCDGLVNGFLPIKSKIHLKQIALFEKRLEGKPLRTNKKLYNHQHLCVRTGIINNQNAKRQMRRIEIEFRHGRRWTYRST